MQTKPMALETIAFSEMYDGGLYNSSFEFNLQFNILVLLK